MSLFHSDKNLSFLDLITYPEITIEKNVFTFILGKSGCGKSSYLKLPNKTQIPTRGKISFNDVDIADLPVLSYRRDVLLVPQDVFLFDKSIEENYKFYYDARDQDIISKERMEEFLRLCCIDFPVDTDCTTLSGGEKQRVFLSIFISLAKNTILLDEPTAALDAHTSAILLSQIKSYCKLNQLTAVCVCHNDALTQQFADKVIRFGE